MIFSKRSSIITKKMENTFSDILHIQIYQVPEETKMVKTTESTTNRIEPTTVNLK